MRTRARFARSAGVFAVGLLAAGLFVAVVPAGVAAQDAGTSPTGVVAWGDSSGGQTAVPAGLTNVIAVAAGQDHSLALDSRRHRRGVG